MGALLQDLRYGVRALWKRPAFTIAAVLILALGIGANTVVFGLFNAVLLRPLNFSSPDRLVWIWATRTDRDKAFYSIPNFLDTQTQSQTLESMAAFANWGANLSGRTEAQRLQGVRISANAFQLLGAEPAAGRLLTPEDEQPDKSRVVVLSYRSWQQLFAGSSQAIGQNLILNGDTYTVI